MINFGLRAFNQFVPCPLVIPDGLPLTECHKKPTLQKSLVWEPVRFKKWLTSPVWRVAKLLLIICNFEGIATFSCFLVCLESFPNIHLYSQSALTSTLSKVNIIDAKVKCAICASRFYLLRLLLLCNHLLISIKINHNHIIASKTFCVKSMDYYWLVRSIK